ncbi:MAG: nucleotidyltransferase family protein [Sedimenticola sp.]|nr:nucleotidyltransferase family protein [Sedimenticola sp.]
MNLLLRILQKPSISSTYDDQQWDLLIRQARSAGLLAHLYHRFINADVFDSIPQKVKHHLNSEFILSNRQHDAARWEISQIQQALEELGLPIVLLKGAAYLQTGLPSSSGRFFSDIDILVPRTILIDTEQRLERWGWYTTHHDEYDQKYYRKWMHEIPPLQHITRKSTIDVHHNILPLTARLHPDPEKLIASSVQINEEFELYVLCPEDMVLHSATHLFHDGELEHGLRDLVDLDRLLRHFGEDDEYWERLVNRSVELELSRPLYYALHYTSAILKTPVPEAILKSDKLDRPSAPMAFLMDKLLMRALMPAHHSCDDWFTGTARWLLYIRSHYLRMPIHLLIPHLFHKSFIRPYNEWKEARKMDKSQNLSKPKTESKPEIDIFE